MTPLVPPGSIGWLVLHDLRLGWRDLRSRTGNLGSPAMAAVIVAAAAIVHLIAWPLAADLGGGGAGAPPVAPAVGGVAAFALLLMLAQTLNGATKLLFARGDLDLLLASPLPPHRLLAARTLAVAAGAFASAGLFLLPVADAAALQGRTRLLALYPTLAGAALLAAATGLALAMGLLRLIGPRRTRVAAQALAALIGAAFTLLLQVERFWPGAALLPALPAAGALHGALMLPVGAAFGDGRALAAWLGLSGAAFLAATLGLGSAFASGAARAAGAAARPRRARPGRDPRRSFRAGGMAGLRAKERRVILRDPWLVSQVLLQVLYMLPMGAALWSAGGGPGLAVAPTLAVIGFQVASALTWLSLSGEDAPDLLATAPVGLATLRGQKIVAVGSLTAAVVGLPLAWLAWAAWRDALVAAALLALGLVTAALLQLWHVKPARRSAFAARYRESRLVTAIEMALSVLFGLTAALGVAGSLWAFAPLGGIGCAVAWLAPRARRQLTVPGRAS